MVSHQQPQGRAPAPRKRNIPFQLGRLRRDLRDPPDPAASAHTDAETWFIDDRDSLSFPQTFLAAPIRKPGFGAPHGSMLLCFISDLL